MPGRIDGSNWIEIEILHTTERAVLIQQHPDVWIPLSLIWTVEEPGSKKRIEDFDLRDRIKVEVPTWFIEKCDLDGLVVENP